MYLFILFLLFFASSALAGPIFPSRSFILAPKFREKSDTTKGAKFLRQQGIWGNIARSFGSEGERSATSISFGGLIEFVQWENSYISLLGDVEVLADPYNDISFNPRAIFWTEGFVYGYRFDERELQFGYIHRCRHEIDNLDKNTVGTGESRNLIYGSLMARLVDRDWTIWGMNWDKWIQMDKYIIREDARIPSTSERGKTDINKLDGSLGAGVKIEFLTLGDAKCYFRYNMTLSAYNSFKNISGDSRAELGIRLSGDAATMNIFLGLEEFLDDDLNRPTPTGSKYVYVGFRFIGKNVGM